MAMNQTKYATKSFPFASGIAPSIIRKRECYFETLSIFHDVMGCVNV